MYYNDHAPPHFHARYAEDEVLINLQSLEQMGGYLPRRALALVFEWADLHRAELGANWERAREGVQMSVIAPLE